MGLPNRSALSDDIRDYVLSKIQASPDSLVWPVVYLLLSFSSLVATIVGLVYLIGSGLLPPAAMTMYLVFLCWQAVSKLPNITPSIAASSPILVPSAIIGAFTVSWT
ncbi:hypothetical protein DYB37_007997 [Aphanomyces astaci]|uniref:Uncharacterized protein n=1 Tax=Aphanomyces astaci TaxID=112090 RepID=A0A418FFY0_APHAT|nr:hypothetical protein DYB37_007997 [Aphanomyces astaci]